MSNNRSARLGGQAAAALLAAAFLAAGSTAAHAAEPDNIITQTTTVTSAGLDLATASGTASLRRRVLSAAQRVCRVDDRLIDTDGDGYAACIKQAVRSSDRWTATRIARATAAATTVRLAQAP